jgi:hypothetical protein
MVEGAYSGMLEASGGDACEWLLSDGFELRLFTFFPCTDITPSAANGSATPDSMHSMAAMLEDPDCMKEVRGWRGCWHVVPGLQRPFVWKGDHRPAG